MYKLLATSALVAAGLWGAMDTASAQQAKPGFPWATSPISVVVGGYHAQIFGTASNKDNISTSTVHTSASFNKTGQHSDSEIWFGGRTTLANGIAIGFDVQLEANSTADTIDESYLFVDGAFGRLVLGSENAADAIMHVGAPGVSASAQISYGTTNGPNVVNWVRRPNNVVAHINSEPGCDALAASGSNVYPNSGCDQQRVNYFTPRFAGLQFGVSFTPNYSSGGGLSTSGEDVNELANRRLERHNVWSGGVNYTNTIAGLGVQLSAGVTSIPSLQNAAAGTAGAGKVTDSSFGGTVEYGQFAIGGHYRRINAENSSTDGSNWSVGGRWTSGPIQVGIYHQQAQAEGTLTTAGKDKFSAQQLAGSYNLGPGIDLIGAIFKVKYQDETTTPANNNSGAGAVTGIVMRF